MFTKFAEIATEARVLEQDLVTRFPIQMHVFPVDFLQADNVDALQRFGVRADNICSGDFYTAKEGALLLDAHAARLGQPGFDPAKKKVDRVFDGGRVMMARERYRKALVDLNGHAGKASVLTTLCERYKEDASKQEQLQTIQTKWQRRQALLPHLMPESLLELVHILEELDNYLDGLDVGLGDTLSQDAAVQAFVNKTETLIAQERARLVQAMLERLALIPADELQRLGQPEAGSDHAGVSFYCDLAYDTFRSLMPFGVSEQSMVSFKRQMSNRHVLPYESLRHFNSFITRHGTSADKNRLANFYAQPAALAAAAAAQPASALAEIDIQQSQALPRTPLKMIFVPAQEAEAWHVRIKMASRTSTAASVNGSFEWVAGHTPQPSSLDDVDWAQVAAGTRARVAADIAHKEQEQALLALESDFVEVGYDDAGEENAAIDEFYFIAGVDTEQISAQRNQTTINDLSGFEFVLSPRDRAIYDAASAYTGDLKLFFEEQCLARFIAGETDVNAIIRVARLETELEEQLNDYVDTKNLRPEFIGGFKQHAREIINAVVVDADTSSTYIQEAMQTAHNMMATQHNFRKFLAFERARIKPGCFMSSSATQKKVDAITDALNQVNTAKSVADLKLALDVLKNDTRFTQKRSVFGCLSLFSSTSKNHLQVFETHHRVVFKA